MSCSSDLRLKKDVVDTGSAVDWLGNMRVRDFTVRASNERRTGVIAQEMLLTHPEMVHMNADGLYTVDEPNTWRFVKAIQELKADNDNLRALFDRDHDEIAKLKADNDNLKTQLKAANDNQAVEIQAIKSLRREMDKLKTAK